MRSTYMIKDPEAGVFAAAIADVHADWERAGAYRIARINVMEQYRGQGYGTKILNMITQDADIEGAKLTLEPIPSGGLGQTALEAWYERHGFAWGAFYMVRKPTPKRR